MTLVEEHERARQRNGTPHPLTPGSPFSASFDPNAPTPATPDLPVPILGGPITRRTSEVWSTTVSSSLNNLAQQFAAASQALAAIPIASEDDESTTSLSTNGIASVQQAQTKLEQELETLREQVAALGERRRAEKEKANELGMLTDDLYREQMETRFLGIEKKLDDLAETIRLE